MFDRYSGLASVLEKSGKAEEAVIWYKKELQKDFNTYGANKRYTQNACFELGSCYEGLGRYDEALKLYQQMIDKIRQVGKDQYGELARFELEISSIQEWLEQGISGPSRDDNDCDGSQTEPGGGLEGDGSVTTSDQDANEPVEVSQELEERSEAQKGEKEED